MSNRISGLERSKEKSPLPSVKRIDRSFSHRKTIKGGSKIPTLLKRGSLGPKVGSKKSINISGDMEGSTRKFQGSIGSIYEMEPQRPDLLEEHFGLEFKRRIEETSNILMTPPLKLLVLPECSYDSSEASSNKNKSIQITDSEELNWHYTDPEEAMKKNLKHLKTREEFEISHKIVRQKTIIMEKQLEEHMEIRKAESCTYNYI